MTNRIRRVAITGAAGYIGRLLTDRLAYCEDVERVVAVDIRPSQRELSSKVTFVQRDVTRDFADLLVEHRVDALVHLAFSVKPDRNEERARGLNVGGMAVALEACTATGVRHLLYISSATVYGAHADNPPLLTEDAPLRPVRGFQYSESKVQVEAMLSEYRENHPEMRLCVLRTCPVIGAGADNFIADSLGMRNLVAVRGYDPQMQFLHGSDAAEIMTRCLLDGVRGTYNVGPRDLMQWADLSQLGGRRLVRLPYTVLYGLTCLTWHLGLQGRSKACGLNFIRYPWVVSGENLEREHGLTVRHSSREAWEEFVSWRDGQQN